MASSRIEFLEIVHQIDHSPLTPNPALGAAIDELAGRKLILTNGTRDHADAVMRRLEIESTSTTCSTSRPPSSSRSRGRRSTSASWRATTSIRHKSAIFEDLARNLEVPHALGMTTVLVVPEGARVVLREEWELAGRDAPHVDHVTDDLTGFLRGVAAERSRAVT